VVCVAVSLSRVACRLPGSSLSLDSAGVVRAAPSLLIIIGRKTPYCN